MFFTLLTVGDFTGKISYSCRCVKVSHLPSLAVPVVKNCPVVMLVYKLTMAYMHLSRKPDSLFDIKIISLINN